MRFIFIFYFTFFIAYIGQAQLHMGIGASVIPQTTNFGAQIRATYDLTKVVTLSGAYDYYFRKSSTFGIDLDAQFKIFNIAEVKISPIAGINIREIENKVNTGLQLGFFIEIPKDHFNLYIEPKVILDEKTVIAIAGGLLF